mgnify:FL=1
MRNKVLSVIAFSLGILLIAASAALFAARQIQKVKTEVDIPTVVKKIEKTLPERSAGVIEKRTDNTMPSIEIDKTDFIGLLKLSGRNIKLPVGAKWDGSEFGFRPAKYLGSVYDGTLIIGGKYAADNFDFADKLDTGEEITFTDMTGKVFRYTVDKISHADNAKTETLTDKDYELTLFVKKKSTFLIIRCKAA